MATKANPDQGQLLEEQHDRNRIPTLEIVLELEREIKVRKSIYPRWIATGKIDKVQAGRRIEILEQILADYTDRMTREAGPNPMQSFNN